jgi:hypothetical protein
MNADYLPCPFCGTSPIRDIKNGILSVYCPKCVSVGFHASVKHGCLPDYQWNERQNKDEIKCFECWGCDNRITEQQANESGLCEVCLPGNSQEIKLKEINENKKTN